MNILHTETLYNWGGQQNKIINEMRFMRELGHKVILFCNPNSEISRRAKTENFKTIECKISKKNFHKTIPIFCKILREENINLVITHGSTDSWIAAIARFFSKKQGVKFARERHNLFPINGILSKIMHRSMFDKILYISQSVKEHLNKLGVKDGRLFYLPSTIDVDKLKNTKSSFREEFKIDEKTLVIGTFTSLYRKKGVFDFALAVKEIFKIHKDMVAVFAGNITDGIKNEISTMFESHEKIIFTDFRADSANVIKAFDVYVFASHSEGLGTVLLEAMSSQVPIVVYNKEPMNVLIKHNERGLCATYLDPNSLAQNIIKLINDNNFGQKCVKNALEFVSQNYDHKELKLAIKNLLESL